MGCTHRLRLRCITFNRRRSFALPCRERPAHGYSNRGPSGAGCRSGNAGPALIAGEAVKCGAVKSGIGGRDKRRGDACVSVTASGLATTTGLATTALPADCGGEAVVAAGVVGATGTACARRRHGPRNRRSVGRVLRIGQRRFGCAQASGDGELLLADLDGGKLQSLMSAGQRGRRQHFDDGRKRRGAGGRRFRSRVESQADQRRVGELDEQRGRRRVGRAVEQMADVADASKADFRFAGHERDRRLPRRILADEERHLRRLQPPRRRGNEHKIVSPEVDVVPSLHRRRPLRDDGRRQASRTEHRGRTDERGHRQAAHD